MCGATDNRTSRKESWRHGERGVEGLERVSDETEELLDAVVTSEGDLSEDYGLATCGAGERIGTTLASLPLAPGERGRWPASFPPAASVHS